MGSTIIELIRKKELEDIKIQTLGYPDEFIKQATIEQIEKKYRLDVQSILNKAKELTRKI